MCGIAGFYSGEAQYLTEAEKWRRILLRMNQVQGHRGPDGSGIFLEEECGLAHVRLSILDLEKGQQPMSKKQDGRICTIVYNGEIYNMQEEKRRLEQQRVLFQTNCDTEVILAGYMQEGIDFVKRLNGIFAFAIWDSALKKLFLCRDRLGVKPLFYTVCGDTTVFSSEIKGLFEWPGVKPEVDREGLCEIFALGPAKTYGKGVFRNIKEVLPGEILEICQKQTKRRFYWKLESREHLDSQQETVEKTAFLVEDAVTLQMLSDIPISTFLSGGVDSSLVTAICAKKLEKQGKQLNTFSFDFQENDKYFQANSFQPSRDRPFVDKMVEYSNTKHRYLECSNEQQADYLYAAVRARDLPCMADVESSMLYFCSKVVDYNKVTLTGECADEIFGGYPWFHSQEAFNRQAFPWSYDMEARKALLKDSVIAELPLEEYARAAYEKTIAETPILEGESPQEKRRREIAYLNLKWFMVTLLDRMDRTSMYSGLEARVPMADHRIVEYVWNVPWEMKCMGSHAKGLLRAAGERFLPKEVLYRKKSPYPKTYHPQYEQLLGNRLAEVLSDPNAPLHALVDKQKAERFLQAPSDYGKPWYGQLMAGPQMLAYMLQVNEWLKEYKIQLV